MIPSNKSQAKIIAYFQAEKAGSLFALIIGVIGLLIGAVFVATQIRFVDAAYPVLLFSLVALVAGGAVWLRSDGQLARVLASYQKNPATFRTLEEARMERVLRNFRYYRWAELALVLLGIWLLTTQFGKAFGVGLLIEVLILLVFDGIAENRAQQYMRYVQSIPSKHGRSSRLTKETGRAQKRVPSRSQ